MQSDTPDFLRDVSLFKELLESQVREFSSRVKRRRYSRNEQVVQQGSPAESGFIVSSAMLAVTRTPPVTGETHNLAYLMPGDLMGELEALAGPHSLATANVTAVTQVELLEMRSTDFLEARTQGQWGRQSI